MKCKKIYSFLLCLSLVMGSAPLPLQAGDSTAYERDEREVGDEGEVEDNSFSTLEEAIQAGNAAEVERKNKSNSNGNPAPSEEDDILAAAAQLQEEALNPDAMQATLDQAQEDVREQDQRTRDGIVNQNTLVAGLGIYKKDLIEGAGLGLNIVGAWGLHNDLKLLRILKILNFVKSNSGQIKEHLIKVREEKRNLLYPQEVQNALAQQATTPATPTTDQTTTTEQSVPQKPALSWKETIKDWWNSLVISIKTQPTPHADACKAYLKENCQLIGYNPFKLDLLLPLLRTTGFFTANRLLQDNALINEPFKLESWNSYARVGDETVPCGFFSGNPPLLSAMPFIKGAAALAYGSTAFDGVEIGALSKLPSWLSWTITTALGIGLGMLNLGSPYMEEAMAPTNAALRGYAQVAGPELPSWYYSVGGAALVNFLFLGLFTKHVDMKYDTLWTSYVLEHDQEFFELVDSYDKATQAAAINYDHTTTAHRVNAEKRIAAFIARGHEPKDKLPGSIWFSSLMLYPSWLTPLYAKMTWEFYKNLPTFAQWYSNLVRPV